VDRLVGCGSRSPKGLADFSRFVIHSILSNRATRPGGLHSSGPKQSVYTRQKLLHGIASASVCSVLSLAAVF